MLTENGISLDTTTSRNSNAGGRNTYGARNLINILANEMLADVIG